MILGLRGSSGSGKSHVGHALVAEYKLPDGDVYWPPRTPPIRNKQKWKLVGHRLRGGLFVLGGYKPQFACGGMDTLGTGVINIQFPMLKRAAMKFEHVFYESLMMALTSVQRMADFQQELIDEGAPSLPLVLPTLDTPVELCRERVAQRREESTRRRKKPTDDKTTIMYAHKRANYLAAQLQAAGLDVPYIDHTKAYEQVVDMLKDGGWKP